MHSSDSIRQGLKISTLEGVLANFQYLLLQNAWLMGLGFLFGLSETTVSILSSFSFLFQIFYFVNVWILNRGIDRKKWVMVLALLARSLWLIPIGVLLFGNPASMGWLFVLIFTSYFILDKLLAHGWNSWMSDLVVPGVRGKYFGFRQGITAMVSAAYHVLIGWTLDRFTSNGDLSAGYATLLAISVLFGLITVFLFSRQTHREQPETSREPLNLASIRMVLADRPFMKTVFVSSTGLLSVGMVIMIIPIYMVEEQKISYSTFAWYQSLILGIGIISYQIFGRILDRFGVHVSLLSSLSGLLTSSFLWLFINQSTLWLFFLDAVVIGVCYSGFLLTNATISLGKPSEPFRNIRIAVYATTSGLAYFLGTWLGGAVTESWSPDRESNILLVFTITILIRIFAVIASAAHLIQLSRKRISL